MKRSSEDNLENFFRKISQNHDFEFKKEDWLKLEAQLDQEMPVGFAFWRMLKNFWYVILLLILIPVSWVVITQTSSTGQNGVEKSGISSMTFQSDGELLKNNNNQNMQKSKSNQDTDHLISKDVKVEQNSPIEKSKNLLLIDKEVNQFDDENKQINEGQKVALATPIIFTENNEELGYVVLENGAGKEGQVLYSELHFLTPISPISILLPGELPDIDSSTPAEIKPKNIFKSYFSFGVGYSPDFSTVGFSEMIAPGSRWTVFTEFSISKRFGINTGIVMVNNKYTALGEDYHPPRKYWQNGIIADEAYGECKMVDIPLNVRYNIISKIRHKLFISAGTSAYFVLKEDYYFTYSDEYPDDLPSHWGTDKTTIYPFGVVNLSLGYQYTLTKKSALQVEPFIKIPTTGIGWGNVDLYTIGTYFIYKFRVGK